MFPEKSDFEVLRTFFPDGITVRYLRYNKVDKMLLFWRAIEIMKNTTNIRQRQVKAQNIMEKFFHDPEKSP